MRFESFDREESTGTGDVSVQIRMQDDPRCWNALPDLEGLYEIDQCSNLSLGEFRSLTVADQTDPDGGPVDLIRPLLFRTVGIGCGSNVCTRKLAVPSIGGFDDSALSPLPLPITK